MTDLWQGSGQNGHSFNIQGNLNAPQMYPGPVCPLTHPKDTGLAELELPQLIYSHDPVPHPLVCRRNRTGSQFTSTGQAGLPRAAHRMHLGIHLKNVEIKAFEETFQTTQKDTQLQNK